MEELDEFVSIRKASVMLGVAVVTLRRWTKREDFDEISWSRTVGKHRRFSLQGIKQFLGLTETHEEDDRIHIGYARVSSHDQKNDLETQIQTLKRHLPEKHEILHDTGSDLNYKKSGLTKLLKKLLSNKVASLTLTYKDRLLRFGTELIFMICKKMHVKVTILFQEETVPFEQELATDMITLATVFSARLYGKRSHKTRRKYWHKSSKLDKNKTFLLQ